MSCGLDRRQTGVGSTRSHYWQRDGVRQTVRMELLSIEHVTAIRRAANVILSSAPEKARRESPRRVETQAVRSSDGGGRTRAELLDRVSVEAAASIAQVLFLVDGLCDLLRAGVARDRTVNTLAAAAVVRSALETSGLALWLLDMEIDGVERGRRYVTWLFDDLKQMRYLADSSSGDKDVDAGAAKYCDDLERQLVEVATAAGWTAQGQRVHASSVEPARLMDDLGKAMKLPGKGDLAILAALAPDAYKILSVPAHGQRYGFHATIIQNHMSGTSQTSGSMLDPGLLVRWGCTAAALPALALARWNQMKSNDLVSLVAPLAAPRSSAPE